MSEIKPGLVVLLGSGETLPSSGKTHEYAAQRLPQKPRIVVLETPAGFEPNSDVVAGKIKTYLERRLQNYKPAIDVLPARHRDTPFSPDDPKIAAPILKADEILLGPGSPTYTVRQLRDSITYQMITARQRRGGMLFLSSSAPLSFSTYTLPVYEVYKVGQDLFWIDGLDFLSSYGLNITFISHWNNTDGGEELDTSRCYMGQDRFNLLRKMLPPDQTIVGIDENTSLIIDFAQSCCFVRGHDTVTILRDGGTLIYETGNSFHMDKLGDWYIPDGHAGIPSQVWEKAIQAEEERQLELSAKPEPTAQVLDLLQAREEARQDKDWEKADLMRDQVEKLGWQIKDTPQGSQLEPLGND